MTRVHAMAAAVLAATFLTTGCEVLDSILSSSSSSDSQEFALRAEDVTAKAGTKGVLLRILASHPRDAQGLSASFRIDPRLARIVNVRKGQETKSAAFVKAQPDALKKGEVSVGVVMELPPTGKRVLVAGADQHVVTVELDLLAAATPGTTIPVTFGTYGDPPGQNLFSCTEEKRTTSEKAGTRDGQITVE